MADQKILAAFSKIKKEILDVFKDQFDYMKKLGLKFPVVQVNYRIDKIGNKRFLVVSAETIGNKDRKSKEVKKIVDILKRHKANEIKMNVMLGMSGGVVVVGKISEDDL